MPIRTAIWLGLVLGLLAGPGISLAGEMRDCLALPVCPAREAVIKAYGLEPAEAVRAQGITAVRAFVFDAWRRGEPAAVFSKRRGGAPRLEVIAYGADALKPQTIQSRWAPPDAWRKAQAAAASVRATAVVSAFDSVREAPALNGEVQEIVCMDSSRVMVEVIGPAGIVRRERVVCIGDPVTDAVWAVGDAALAISPGCAGLDKRTWGSPFIRLNLCRWLRGDLGAAAEVRNITGAEIFSDALYAPESGTIGQWFEPASTLAWENRKAEGPIQIADLWRQVAKPDTVQFYYDIFDGKSANRVRVTGVAQKSRTGLPDETAAFTVVWIRQPGGSWRIRDLTIEPFAESKSQ